MALNPYHVLIVEDDSPTLTGISEWLQVAHHCRAAQASNAGEALYWLGKERFDVVITGVNMPGMNGLELTRVIRKTYGTPVIVMTGYYRWERVRQAYANGARAFLRKPFKVQLLKEVIDLVAGKGLHYIGPRGRRIRETSADHGVSLNGSGHNLELGMMQISSLWHKREAGRDFAGSAG